jgi:hypothetical protein
MEQRFNQFEVLTTLLWPHELELPAKRVTLSALHHVERYVDGESARRRLLVFGTHVAPSRPHRLDDLVQA